MALPQIIADMCKSLSRLRDELQTLHLTITEDRPAGDCVILVDQLGNSVEDLIGWCQEAIDNALSAQRAVESDLHYLLAIRAIGNMHERVLKLSRRYHADLASYERLSELVALGREKRSKRPEEWQAWSQSVRDGIEGCQHLFVEVDNCLLSCWREFLGPSGLHSRRLFAVTTHGD